MATTYQHCCIINFSGKCGAARVIQICVCCDTCSDSYITEAPRQISDSTPRPHHVFSSALVLMASALESTCLECDDKSVKDREERVTRKAETADAVQDAIQLLHIAACVPREIRTSGVGGFKPRSTTALLRGRIKREEKRLARAALRQSKERVR